MTTTSLARAFAVSAALCGLAASSSFAAQGVDAGSVTFVQVADTSGSRSALTQELDAGTQAYFKHINSQGGINGRQLLLKTVDDGYVVKRTIEATREQIEKDDVFAFVSAIGTANAEAVLPMINEAKVPLVAPLSGAISLREPF